MAVFPDGHGNDSLHGSGIGLGVDVSQTLLRQPFTHLVNVETCFACFELCSLFVDPDHTRQGTATQLMERAYEDVIAAGVENLWLYSSLTAVPFYENDGWQFVAHSTRGSLACVRMEKAVVENGT